MQIPEKGFYQHHKYDPSGEPFNYTYEVIGIGRNTEEGTYTVLYRPLYKNDWLPPADFQSRPLEMFIDNVEKDGHVFKRFEKISDPEVIAKLEQIRDEMYS